MKAKQGAQASHNRDQHGDPMLQTTQVFQSGIPLLHLQGLPNQAIPIPLMEAMHHVPSLSLGLHHHQSSGAMVGLPINHHPSDDGDLIDSQSEKQIDLLPVTPLTDGLQHAHMQHLQMHLGQGALHHQSDGVDHLGGLVMQHMHHHGVRQIERDEEDGQ
eukprot:TRINITY_DN15322_c0_g1_i1.p1 TRINITY_DN15322_c0_g1~~TRINITY_DN15322_c0_g1_i1.p1  ORF type:complete len:173 (-),score=40.19 TRINITY_DN15322_c0_g1_i1:18-494(-)